MTEEVSPQAGQPDDADVYLATSLELLERSAEALREEPERAALLELIATVRRHTAAMREHLEGLGVVELGTRAHDLAERADALERRERELRDAEEAFGKAEAPLEGRQPEADATYLLFLPGAEGYELVERQGPCPTPGEPVLVGGREVEVAKVARSPLPDDRRLCAYAY